MLKTFSWHFPVKIRFGVGIRREIASAAKELGAKKVFVVTGKTATKKSPYLEEIIESLKAAKLDVQLFAEVEADPSFETIDKGAIAAKKFKADLILGYGGGSPMDAAKFISMLLTNPGSAADYVHKKKEVKKQAIPLFTLPTTAGTGSEVTRVTVATDKATGEKMGVLSPLMYAHTAFLDPEPHQTMPASVAAATGMDALTHAVEGYLSRFSDPISEGLCLEAIRLISESIRPSVAHGDNLEARGQMLLGSLIAGIGFTLPGTGAVHALAHILGGKYGVPHGVANGMLLPYVMEYNRIANPEKFARIARALGEPVDELTTLEAAHVAVDAMTNLRDDLGLPCCLEELSIPQEDLPLIAKLAMNQRAIGNNVRKVTEQDLLSILEVAYEHGCC